MHQDAGAGENCVGSYLRLPAAIARFGGALHRRVEKQRRRHWRIVSLEPVVLISSPPKAKLTSHFPPPPDCASWRRRRGWNLDRRVSALTGQPDAGCFV